MKKHNERLDFNVSTWVSLELKNKLYEMAERENTTVSNIARTLLEKGLGEYEEVNNYGN